MRAPIDWTGIRSIHERCRQTPGHPMNVQEQRMKTQADHARAYRQRKAAKLERLARLEGVIDRVVEAYDDASNYDMLTADLEAAVEEARQALGDVA